jgi:uncharacterized membrane protein
VEPFLECPSCGHHLSMYQAPEPSSGERTAIRVASWVATWWFPTAILALVALWAIVNVSARPFEPYPVVVLAWISAVLATVAALQGPLILMAQRRAAMSDRQRDEEAFRIAMNTEADMHRVAGHVDLLNRRVNELLESGSAADPSGERNG